MATIKLSALPTAVGIDPVNDFIPIVQSSVTNKISRNVLQGITGSTVGTTDTQALSNKTIGNTNAITVKDGGFTLQNTADTTKQGIFSLSGNTTGTTRTYSLPNASVTLASLTGTEMFTNKTITSPIITGGTIDNTSITVDAISGHTTGTVVTVANLQISNGVLNSANAVTATSIAAGAVQPQALVAGTGSGWTWQSFTPTAANFTKGNGTESAKYIQIGKTVFVRYFFVLGNTSAIGTGPTLTFPVAPSSSYTQTGVVFPVGQVSATSGGSEFMLWVIIDNTTTFRFAALGTGSTYLGGLTGVTASVPGTWGTNDSILAQFYYEAA